MRGGNHQSRLSLVYPAVKVRFDRQNSVVRQESTGRRSSSVRFVLGGFGFGDLPWASDSVGSALAEMASQRWAEV